MSKGRRAAERRRQRENATQQDAIKDGASGTAPGSTTGGRAPNPTERISMEDAVDGGRTQNWGHPEDDTQLSNKVQAIDPDAPEPTEESSPAAAVTDQNLALQTSNSRRDLLDFDESRSLMTESERLVAEESRADDTQPNRKASGQVVAGGSLQLLYADPPQHWDLKESPLVIGRGADATVAIDDITVSRNHLEMYWSRAKGWEVTDPGSGSGSLLNGEILGARTPIKHGDVIALGKSEVRFVRGPTIPSAAKRTAGTSNRAQIAPTRASTFLTRITHDNSGTPRKLGLGAAAVMLIVLVIAAGFGAKEFRARQQTAHHQQQISVLLEKAEAALNALKLDDARAQLEAVLALDPTNAKAKSLMKLLTSEFEAQEALEQARSLLAAGKFDEARQALMRIPDSSRFREQRNQLRTQLYQAEMSLSRQAILDAMAAREYSRAQELFDVHQKAFPDDPQLANMQKRIEAGPPKIVLPAALRKAQRAFASGQISKARVMVQSASSRGVGGAQAYLTRLSRFESLLNDGKAQIKKKNGAAATRSLNAAYRLLVPLGGTTSGDTATTVRRPLADGYILTGVNHLQRGRDCAGAKDILQAHWLAPSVPKVKKQKARLDRMARAALERARARVTGSPAAAKRIAKGAQCLATSASSLGKELRRLAR